MRNTLALGFVLVVLSACAAHVYTNTHVRERDDYGQWAHAPKPYWHRDGRSIRDLD